MYIFIRKKNCSSISEQGWSFMMGRFGDSLIHLGIHSSFLCLTAEIISEPPNNRLSKFDGKMQWKGQTYSLDNEKILLRGCVLRNTEWCYGVVIFAGKDTKLMMNSGKTKFKRTHIDRFMNKLIIGVSIICDASTLIDLWTNWLLV